MEYLPYAPLKYFSGGLASTHLLPLRSHSMIKCSGGTLIGLFQTALDFCKGIEIEIGIMLV